MLTPKQQLAYHFIRDYIFQNGHAPTDAQIAAGIGIKSRGVAHRYVTALVDAGFVRIIKGRRRNIELVEQEEVSLAIPIIGKIAAGHPIEAIEDRQMLHFADKFLGDRRFILQVKGDSMIGDNILDGDYIVCEKINEARENDIIIALIDGCEATLKRFHPNEDGTITLIPSNPKLSAMVYPADCVIIQGRYLGLLRLPK